MARIVLVGLMIATLGGCRGSDRKDAGPTYTPIADEELFARIAKVPGVTSVDVAYRDNFGDNNDYVGDVVVAPDADGKAILDAALAILRQGRPHAALTVFVLQNNKEISPLVLGLKSSTDQFLTERYGPQPGNGKPPS